MFRFLGGGSRHQRFSRRVTDGEVEGGGTEEVRRDNADPPVSVRPSALRWASSIPPSCDSLILVFERGAQPAAGLLMEHLPLRLPV